MTEKESSTGQGGANENTSNSTSYDNMKIEELQATLLSEIEPDDELDACPDIGTLLDDIVTCLNRYVSLPDYACETIALWLAFTHVVEFAKISPRLALVSPAPGCGKTTLITVMTGIAANARPTSNATPAAIYRFVELKKGKITLLVDELDSFTDDKSEIFNILNAGHERNNSSIFRCDGDQHAPKEFPCFCAVAIAQIGEIEKPAFKSRCIVVRMQRAAPGEQIAKIKSDDEQRLKQLGKELAVWAAKFGKSVVDAEPSLPSGFNNRLADNWQTLLAIADCAGDHWRETARKAAQALSDVPEASNSEAVLAAIRKAMKGAIIDRISTADLCKKLFKSDDRILSRDGLAKALRPFGIKPKAMRIDGKSVRGYMLCDFEDAFTRYLTCVDDEGNQNED